MNGANEVFNEQLVKKQPNSKDVMKKIGIIVAAIIVILVILTLIPQIVLPAMLVEGFILVLVFRRMNVEYEYILTNNELDIDRIFNKNSRKKGMSIDVKSFVIVAPVLKKEYVDDLKKFDKVIDFSSGVVTENTYAALLNKDGKRVKLIIEPNEKMLKAMRMYCPSAIKK